MSISSPAGFGVFRNALDTRRRPGARRSLARRLGLLAGDLDQFVP